MENVKKKIIFWISLSLFLSLAFRNENKSATINNYHNFNNSKCKVLDSHDSGEITVKSVTLIKQSKIVEFNFVIAPKSFPII